MKWENCLKMGPTRLAEILGCPVTTAHSWIRRSGPPEWQKRILAAEVARRMKREGERGGGGEGEGPDQKRVRRARVRVA